MTRDRQASGCPTQPRLARRYLDSLRRAATVLEVGAFSGSLCGLRLVLAKRCYLVQPGR